MKTLAKKKMPSGGKRKNAGRPLKYGEPVEAILIKVPVSKKTEFKKLIASILKKWEVKNN